MHRDDSAHKDTSVYVHFPWCARKCPYCDFASTAKPEEQIPHQEYADAVLQELEVRADLLKERRLVSIFIGGGTPSMWAGSALGRVLRGIKGAFEHTASNLEVTAECNPVSLDSFKAEAFASAGVNRMSIGVQSLRETQLQFLGRLHDRQTALQAIHAAQRFVGRVSADLMFGMPQQKQIRDEINAIIDTGVEHVSAYALTIEPGTQFGTLARMGRLKVSSDDQYAHLYQQAEAIFEEHGFYHYEVSNYARPGQHSRHNAHYWRARDYLGLGAAAVGCLSQAPGQARRYRNESNPFRYMSQGREEEEEHLGPQELVQEALMLGLRTREGVDLESVQARANRDPFEGRQHTVERRLLSGDLLLQAGKLSVPSQRWLYLDSIVADLF